MPMARRDLKDMVGFRFGTRTVIEYAGEKRWRVRCDCGREVVLQGGAIRQNRGALGCVCPATELARFNAKWEQQGDCHIWTACLHGDGYGTFKTNLRKGQAVLAHKWRWEREHGPVPDGLELDHLCRNRACVNPAHLEAVSHAVNVRRGALGEVTKARHAALRAQRSV